MKIVHFGIDLVKSFPFPGGLQKKCSQILLKISICHDRKIYNSYICIHLYILAMYISSQNTQDVKFIKAIFNSIRYFNQNKANKTQSIFFIQETKRNILDKCLNFWHIGIIRSFS